MEGSYFPEDKDLAHKIMMDLSNEDLVKICATNKRMYDVCNNYPDFWRNKFIKDYGEIIKGSLSYYATQYKPENRSWKNHYITVFIDLQKYKNDPVKFLDVIAWKDNIESSYFLDYNNKTFIPLQEAPEWVMNNLFLLNIGEVKLVTEDDNRGTIYTKTWRHIKPINFLLSQVSMFYIIGVSRFSRSDKSLLELNDRTISGFPFQNWLIKSKIN